MNLKRGALKAIITLTAAVATLSLATAASAAVYWPTAADSLTKTSFAVDSQENFASSQGYSTLFNAKDQLCETLGESPCATLTTVMSEQLCMQFDLGPIKLSEEATLR